MADDRQIEAVAAEIWSAMTFRACRPCEFASADKHLQSHYRMVAGAALAAAQQVEKVSSSAGESDPLQDGGGRLADTASRLDPSDAGHVVAGTNPTAGKPDYDTLLKDGAARQRGENLDGTERRETHSTPDGQVHE